MPELRKDLLSGNWVILSPERPLNRADLLPAWSDCPDADQRYSETCPLCPGNEGFTPHEVHAHRPSEGAGSARNGPGWLVRVMPHKFPALVIEGDQDRRASGVYDRMGGVGAHEVVVETPEHGHRVFSPGAGDYERVLWAYRQRISDLKRDQRFRYVHVFKNHGERAGAGLYHAHSQLLALPVIPQAVQTEAACAEAHYRLRERCLLCDILHQELAERQRLVFHNRAAAVIAPYASRTPFELWVVPQRHGGAFEDHPAGEMFGLGEALHVALRLLKQALDDPPYRYTLVTAPFGEGTRPHLHWHMKIVPVVAGCEWGSGCHVNPTSPEEAAHYLRGLDAGPLKAS